MKSGMRMSVCMVCVCVALRGTEQGLRLGGAPREACDLREELEPLRREPRDLELALACMHAMHMPYT